MENLFPIIALVLVAIIGLKMAFPKRSRINIGQQNDIDHYENMNS